MTLMTLNSNYYQHNGDEAMLVFIIFGSVMVLCFLLCVFAALIVSSEVDDYEEELYRQEEESD